MSETDQTDYHAPIAGLSAEELRRRTEAANDALVDYPGFTGNFGQRGRAPAEHAKPTALDKLSGLAPKRVGHTAALEYDLTGRFPIGADRADLSVKLNQAGVQHRMGIERGIILLRIEGEDALAALAKAGVNFPGSDHYLPRNK